MKIDARQLNSLALAYIGDAVYEVHVRTYLLIQGEVKPNQLHQAAVHFVAANKQARVAHYWLEENILTADEIAILKRGRNAKSASAPKNMKITDYRYATAFEALIGHHYISENGERLKELMNTAIEYLKEE